MTQNINPQTMDITLQYPELSEIATRIGVDKLNLQSIFPQTDGFFVKRNNKKKVEYLTKAQPLLSKMLAQGEVIEYIARGTLHSSFEMFFAGGYWTRYINFTTLVLTNYRLLMINTNSKSVPKDMLYSQVRMDQIRKVQGGMLGNFMLKLNDKKNRIYREVPSPERKILKQMIDQKINQPQSAAGQQLQGAPSCENLCTTCYKVVPKGEYQCQACNTQFRTPRAAALRSLILPGLGDLYLKHHTLAILEMVGSLAIYAVLLVGAMANNDPIPVFGALFIIAIINSFDALVTYYIAKKGLIPLEKPQPA